MLGAVSVVDVVVVFVAAVDGGAVHVVAGVCGGVGVFGLLFFLLLMQLFLLLLLLGWGCSC